MQLLDVRYTAHTPDRFLAEVGRVFATFDRRSQDSGNVSYGVECAGARFFVKTAGSPSMRASLSHGARVEWLRNAIRSSASVDDPALYELRNVIESAHGPMLVYEWASGELIGCARERRGDPASAFARFKRLSLPELTAALTAVFRAHAALCAHGWIASDFYDGSMMYDFALRRIKVVDLDMYREGAFINERGRMFGSTRFTAPEEFVLGAQIDETTTVFTMGRCISVFLEDRVEQGTCNELRGLLNVAERACREERTVRWASMKVFLDEWQRAVSSAQPG